MLAGKLVLFALVPVVGAGIVYPMVTRFGGGSKEQTEPLNAKQEAALTKISDFEEKCWVSLQGESSDDTDGFNKKLLACRVAENPERVEFYFYNKISGSDTLPQTVTEIKKTAGSEYQNPEFTLTLSNRKETITAIGLTWDSVFSKSLPRGCQIVIQIDSSQEEHRKLKCGDTQYRPTLEKFAVKKQK